MIAASRAESSKLLAQDFPTRGPGYADRTQRPDFPESYEQSCQTPARRLVSLPNRQPFDFSLRRAAVTRSIDPAERCRVVPVRFACVRGPFHPFAQSSVAKAVRSSVGISTKGRREREQ